MNKVPANAKWKRYTLKSLTDAVLDRTFNRPQVQGYPVQKNGITTLHLREYLICGDTWPA